MIRFQAKDGEVWVGLLEEVRDLPLEICWRAHTAEQMAKIRANRELMEWSIHG